MQYIPGNKNKNTNMQKLGCIEILVCVDVGVVMKATPAGPDWYEVYCVRG